MDSAAREREEERGEGRGTAVEQALFPAYKGPPSEALRVFGSLVFSVLQPKIEQMLVWLYPSNPTRAKQGLAGNILRDSQDPGASDVIAAGGKLPTPRSMNDLFVEYDGPVLIAQGSLDPLNDAVARAKSFEDIRAGISVELMPLGHCPMDENPKMVSAICRLCMLVCAMTLLESSDLRMYMNIANIEVNSDTDMSSGWVASRIGATSRVQSQSVKCTSMPYYLDGCSASRKTHLSHLSSAIPATCILKNLVGCCWRHRMGDKRGSHRRGAVNTDQFSDARGI